MAQLDFGFYGLALHGLLDFCMFYLRADHFSVTVDWSWGCFFYCCFLGSLFPVLFRVLFTLLSVYNLFLLLLWHSYF